MFFSPLRPQVRQFIKRKEREELLYALLIQGCGKPILQRAIATHASIPYKVEFIEFKIIYRKKRDRFLLISRSKLNFHILNRDMIKASLNTIGNALPTVLGFREVAK
jgi:hypothetical protein